MAREISPKVVPRFGISLIHGHSAR